MLVSEFSVDDERVAAAIRAYLDAGGPDRRNAQTNLRQTLSSPRMSILKQFNLLPEGSSFWLICVPTCSATCARVRNLKSLMTNCTDCLAAGSILAISS
ncbi:MAG: hypothetical protein EXR39_10595 [Betaproteobacteria bacterium]|nr:hypothetical protein [Betaproteobacteria bacterium]